ncbi:hypothetical protein HSB1_19180 [Halogranum salarium B-1]|uniref:Uncharacterized protein n=1 Tax=Halogranum salarium B-1 TaxID=1210908 RepID=J2ZGF7_9EURY|nr:hypothetical protein HSB1_19180 [Halogranum salarium B-1]
MEVRDQYSCFHSGDLLFSDFNVRTLDTSTTATFEWVRRGVFID